MASSSRAATKQLMRVLASPSKVANALDWRRSTGGAIATLDIHADRIGVRISQHPENNSNNIMKQQDYSLPVTPRGRTKIPESTRQQLSDLVHQHKVCGFVVAWPLQQDTGLMGAACGRTLFAIEELLRTDLDTNASTETQNASVRPVFAPNRPLCLWDSSHSDQQQSTDVFGRSPLYARTSDKTTHLASREQYHQDESVEGSGIWNDFVKTHWPDNHKNEEQLMTSSRHNVNMTMWNRDESSSQQRTHAAA